MVTQDASNVLMSVRSRLLAPRLDKQQGIWYNKAMGQKHQNGRMAEPIAAYLLATKMAENDISISNDLDDLKNNIQDTIDRNKPNEKTIEEGWIAGKAFADYLFDNISFGKNNTVEDIGAKQSKTDPTDLRVIVDGFSYNYSLKTTSSKSVSLGAKTVRSVLNRCFDAKASRGTQEQIHLWKDVCNEYYESPEGKEYLISRGGKSSNPYRDARCSEYYKKIYGKTSSSVIQNKFEQTFNRQDNIKVSEMFFVIGEKENVATLICYLKDKSAIVVPLPAEIAMREGDKVTLKQGKMAVNGMIVDEYSYSVWNDGTIQFKRKLKI